MKLALMSRASGRVVLADGGEEVADEEVIAAVQPQSIGVLHPSYSCGLMAAPVVASNSPTTSGSLLAPPETKRWLCTLSTASPKAPAICPLMKSALMVAPVVA